MRKLILFFALILLVVPFLSADTAKFGTSVTVSGNESLIINSPIADKLYNSKRILVDVSVSSTVKKLQYSKDGRRWRNLCRDCDSYSKYKNFYKHENNVKFRAIKYDNSIIEESVDFYVDSRKPRIHSIQPRKSISAEGTFKVTYTEANTVNVTLFYKGIREKVYKHISKSTCPSGTRVSCEISADLSEYSGKKLRYFFKVEDPFRYKNSKKRKIKVN